MKKAHPRKKSTKRYMKKAPPRKKSTKRYMKKAPPRKKSTKRYMKKAPPRKKKKVILILAVLCGIVVSIAKCERGLFDHDNAMTVKAVITDVRPFYGGGYGSNYKAVYEYSVNGGTYNSSDQICYDTYKRLNIGDTVSVLVNNNDYNKTELLLEQDKILKFHIDF